MNTRYFNKLRELLPEPVRQFGGLVSLTFVVILTFYEASNHYKLSKEQYETVCKITKIIPQRAVMGANLINFKATQIYTTNGNQIVETFVNWDKEKNKCIAGFVLSGSIDGVKKEKITVSGEVLNFLSTGIDTRVYFIKNF